MKPNRLLPIAVWAVAALLLSACLTGTTRSIDPGASLSAARLDLAVPDPDDEPETRYG